MPADRLWPPCQAYYDLYESLSLGRARDANGMAEPIPRGLNPEQIISVGVDLGLAERDDPDSVEELLMLVQACDREELTYHAERVRARVAKERAERAANDRERADVAQGGTARRVYRDAAGRVIDGTQPIAAQYRQAGHDTRELVPDDVRRAVAASED